jgi:hypothetical protein
MKSFVVNAKKALFGWPFYTGWNLVAYTIEHRRPTAKPLRPLSVLLFFVLTTAVWATLWVMVFWLLMQTVSLSLSFV